ncbi:MAG: hypothetical protein HXX09_14920 [Bacteroidetes bacterium]|nr:hypothetical protein [Bacteroidota bacterium]
MNFSANIELNKLDKYYPKSDLNHIYQKHREQIILILNSIESVWKAKKLDDKNFEILYEGLGNSWSAVFYNIIGKEINSMIGKINGFEKLILTGIEDHKWQTRFNTIIIMKGFEKKEIQNKVIELGLKDKSTRVREMALDVKTYWMD